MNTAQMTQMAQLAASFRTTTPSAPSMTDTMTTGQSSACTSRNFM